MSKTTPGKKYVPISLSCDKLKGEMYLIKQKNIDKCRDNAQDWKKYFKVCDASDKIDVKPKEFFKLLELSSTENNVLASLSPEEKIKNLFINKNVNLDSEDAEEESEAAEDTYQKVYSDIINRIHRLNVTHMHELDFKAYEKKKGEEKRIIKEQIDNFGLLPESPKTNIFTEAGIDFSNNQMTFVHPLYFYNHLKTAGMLEFNPYAGLSYAEINNFPNQTTYLFDSDKEQKTKYDLSQKVKSNPGFAPFLGKGNSQAIAGDGPAAGYAKINGYFYESYPRRKGGFYPHEGIDFAGLQISRSKPKEDHPPIHSFIQGVVVKLGNQQEDHYGLHMVVSDGVDKLYLLGHLCGYADGITVGTHITPGMTVGYVGNTGNCTNKTEQGGGSHLHLSVYVTPKAKDIVGAKDKESALYDVLWDKQNNNYKWFYNSMLVNPFETTGEKK